MVALFFSSIISFFIFIILGTCVSKITKFSTGFTEKTLIGLVATNVITSILSLFLPINIYILIGILIGCFVLIFYIRDEIQSLFSILKKKNIVIICALPFIASAFIISLCPPQMWDAGLYHIQTIKWIEAYPVVPGLANLQGRFGYNNNIFQVFALTSLFEIYKQEIFSVNFTLFSVFALYYINRLYLVFKQYGIINLFVFDLIVFIIILNLSLRNLSDPTPDFISLIIPLFILSKIFKSIVLKENIGLNNYLPILILCVYVLTVKLAALPIILFPVFIFFKFKFEIRKLTWITCLLSLIIIPWLIRNIILTGWLIYPFHSINLFDFDWKVPVSDLITMNQAVVGWARIPGEQYLKAAHMNIFEWFPFWWNRLLLTDKVEFIAALSFPLIILFVYLIKKIKIDFHSFSFLTIPFAGVLFWLVLAPDLRFGKTFIIMAAISPLLYLKFKFYYEEGKNFKPIYIFLTVIMILIPLFNSFVKKNNGNTITQLAQINSNSILTPPIIEKTRDMKFRAYTINGVDIYFPASPEEDRCFDHCIPCMPAENNSLLLRSNELQSGFKYNYHIQKLKQ